MLIPFLTFIVIVKNSFNHLHEISVLLQMNTAMLAVQDHSTCPGYPSLFINMRSKPSIFPIDAWKHILLSLHFDLTEPEGNRDLDLIEVNVTANVTLPLLQGFTLILQSLLGKVTAL